jgi:hypothetical protein
MSFYLIIIKRTLFTVALTWKVHTATMQALSMAGNVQTWDGLQWHDVHIKFL